MNLPPLVSVFLPTYNQQEFISESIESVLNQDYENLEIVIGDDCSQDKTWEIVQDYQRRYHKKIKAFRNEKNLGITGNCNEVLRQCTGKYIVFTAGDDLFLPDKISSQVVLMEKDSSIVLSYHDIEVFSSKDGKTIRFWNSGRGSSSPVVGLASKVVAKVVEKRTSFMAALSVMVRRSAVPTGGYDVRIPVASDWLMWIEVLAGAPKNATVAFIPSVLAKYRRHGANVTAAGYKHTADLLVTLAITEDKYPFLIRSIERGRALLRYSLGVNKIIAGNVICGRRFLWASFFSGNVSLSSFYWLFASYFPLVRRIRERFRQIRIC
jgi:glycosyltransferase involved in cell wall biosynthesis